MLLKCVVWSIRVIMGIIVFGVGVFIAALPFLAIAGGSWKSVFTGTIDD